MPKSNEKKSQNNIVTGIASAVGGAAGIAVGGVAMSTSADAQEVITSQPEHVQTHHSEPQTTHQSHPDEIAVKPEQTGEHYVVSEPNVAPSELNQATEPDIIEAEPAVAGFEKPEPIEAYISETDPQIEVISCDIIETVDGEVELAVVNVDGVEVALADLNMNGEADIIMCDVNDDGIIDTDEMLNVEGQGISMSLFENESVHGGPDDYLFDDPLMAENDLPDYVNDADVDSFMA